VWSGRGMAAFVCIPPRLAPRHSPRPLGIASFATRDEIVKKGILPIVSFVWFLLMLMAVLSGLPADGADKPTQRKIYDESADGDKQVADAAIIAKREHKRILLQFGANWCGWCLKLHRLFESDKAVHDELSTHYVLVLIDVNQDHNKGFAMKHGADQHALPFLAVLDSDGKILTTKDTSDLEEGDHHNPQKVLAFLKTWQPGGVTPPQVSFAPNPKVTFISLEGLDGGLKRAYFRAENSGPSTILCRVHVEQRGGSETANFSIPSGGSTPFSFFVRPGDTPRITAEVLQPLPVSQFAVPMPNESAAPNGGPTAPLGDSGVAEEPPSVR
jgi:thiol-disulfide isomerase/thioredoxin